MPGYLQVAGAVLLAGWFLLALKRTMESNEQVCDENQGDSHDESHNGSRWRASGFKGL